MMDAVDFLDGAAAARRCRTRGRPFTVLLPFFEQGFRQTIANGGDCHMELMECGDYSIPLGVNPGTAATGTCQSPRAFFIRSAAEEIRRGSAPYLLRQTAAAGLEALDLLLHGRHLDRCTMVNHWGLLQPIEPQGELPPPAQWLPALTQRYPDHAPLLLISPEWYPERARELQDAGFRLIPARVAYRWKPEVWKMASRKKRLELRRDFKLLDNPQLEFLTEKDDLSWVDPNDLHSLFENIYIHKYSEHNPQFTSSFFASLLKERSFHLNLIRADGELVGFGGWCQTPRHRHNILLGHRPTEAAPSGLYRPIVGLAFRDCLETGESLYLSSGAGQFKSLRAAESVVEYFAVYDRHLPASRRVAWATLEQIYRKLTPYFFGTIQN